MTAISEAIERLVKRVGGTTAIVRELEKHEGQEQTAQQARERQAALKRLAELPKEREEQIPALQARHREAVDALQHFIDRGKLETENRLREAVREADRAIELVRGPIDAEERELREAARLSCPFRDVIANAQADLAADDNATLQKGDSRIRQLSGSNRGGTLDAGSTYVTFRPSAEKRREAIRLAKSEHKRLHFEDLSREAAVDKVQKIMAALPPCRGEVYEVTAGSNRFLRVATKKDLSR